jgi:dipeptidyl-peptidase-4
MLATASLFALPAAASSQQKTRFASLDQALEASSVLSGRSGPRDVYRIDGGDRFS